MGAQGLLSRPFTNGSVTPLKDCKGSLFEIPTPCFLQPIKWNSLPANPAYHLAPCRMRSSQRQLLCAVSSQKVEDVLADLGHHKLKPSRKNLAVFVSGGGSNFKAIHAATLNGTVFGDVVVLVTNKGDMPDCISKGDPPLTIPTSVENLRTHDFVEDII